MGIQWRPDPENAVISGNARRVNIKNRNSHKNCQLKHHKKSIVLTIIFRIKHTKLMRQKLPSDCCTGCKVEAQIHSEKILAFIS